MWRERVNWRKFAASAPRRWLAPLALASFGGFVIWAGVILIYDATGGQGPLAPIGDWPILAFAYYFFLFGLGPIIYAVATWRLNLRGVFIALAGVGFIGPWLFWSSPWQAVDAEGRYGYYDEGRGWKVFGLLILGVGWFLVVPVLTVMTRKVWRHYRPLLPDEVPIASL